MVMAVSRRSPQLRLVLGEPEIEPQRPRTRADCLPGGPNEMRPCPYVACKHHAYLQVRDDGSIQYNHQGLEPWEIPETCVLDQAEHGGLLLHEAAPVMGMTPQWMNVIELAARDKMRQAERLRAHADGDDGMTLSERILRAFAAMARRGQRLVSSSDVCRELQAEQRPEMMRIYVEIGRLASTGKLHHDGGRADGKRLLRLYWLAEDGK
jgi:hypothetical protein